MGLDAAEESGPAENLSVSDAARYLSLSPTTIHRLVGDLPAMRVDGHWRLRVSDLEEWILRMRRLEELPAEPVDYPGREARLHPYLNVHNIFLDAPETHADRLIRAALSRSRIEFAVAPGGTEESILRERLSRSVLEREELSSTAYHPDAAFPHPKGDERGLLGANHIILVRAAGPVDFRDALGRSPRIVFILLARTISTQLIWEARLSHLVHRESLISRLLAARSAEDVHTVFRERHGEDAV